MFLYVEHELNAFVHGLLPILKLNEKLKHRTWAFFAIPMQITSRSGNLQPFKFPRTGPIEFVRRTHGLLLTSLQNIPIFDVCCALLCVRHGYECRVVGLKQSLKNEHVFSDFLNPCCYSCRCYLCTSYLLFFCSRNLYTPKRHIWVYLPNYAKETVKRLRKN